MKPLLFIGIILAWSCCARNAIAEDNRAIKQFSLDEYVIYSIPVACEQGTTTILFPSAIQGLRAARVTTAANQSGDFVLEYKPGNYYFSLRALKKDAADTMTVIFDRKAYVLRLAASDKPIITATFFRSSRQPNPGKTSPVTPSHLLSILDQCKAYRLLSQEHPEAVAGVAYLKTARTMYYRDFKVVLDEVFRFEEADTVVFRLLLENDTSEPIYYQPHELAVRVGDCIYTQSVADASGVIPPKATIPAYFAITGTPSGGRNNLDLKNAWNVLVARIDPPKKS